MRPVGAAVCLVLVATGLSAVDTQKGRIKRAVLRNVERDFDGKLRTTPPVSSFDLMGTTRGVYLEGYGAVFSSEINLLPSATVSPFQPTMPRNVVEQLHKSKLERVPVLKQTMRDLLQHSATMLKDIPSSEQIILGVSIFYYSWEDTRDLPAQIVMRASRQTLLGGASSGPITAEEY
jgi:hypothetical protein